MEQTKAALETHLAECQLRYEIFEEKLDILQAQQNTINKHTFELRQMMTWFMGAAASFGAIGMLLGVIFAFKQIL
tara:strand:+ start:369 stop:593 length:225 start_codon:yes stop_codon:yes gene_type:complete